MRAGSRGLGALVAAALVLGAAAAIPAGASSDDPAGKGASCKISGQERDLGPSYMNELKARNVSCRYAKEFAVDYYKCRKQNGGRDGHCRKLHRFRCHERRETAPAQFSAKARCVRGDDEKIVQEYSQNT